MLPTGDFEFVYNCVMRHKNISHMQLGCTSKKLGVPGSQDVGQEIDRQTLIDKCCVSLFKWINCMYVYIYICILKNGIKD